MFDFENFTPHPESLGPRTEDEWLSGPGTAGRPYPSGRGAGFTQDYIRPIPPQAEKVFEGDIFTVWHWEQKLFDGSTTIFEGLSRPDYAFAVGVLPNKQILLVEDEQPDRGALITPAGGRVDDGEKPADAAKREFWEETGYQVQEIIPWFSYQPSNKVDMKCHAFIAKDLQKVSEPQEVPGERTRVVTYSFDEFLKLGSEPKLRDWMLHIHLLEAMLYPEKREALKKLLFE